MSENQKLKEALLTENRQIPRYTSYPTAPHFDASITGETAKKWVSAIPADGKVSLYFHIPYCRTLCWYCGCHTKATKRYSPVASFLDTLAREISIIASTANTRLRVDHIHFGGGSPSMLRSEDFSRLMSVIRAHFVVADDAEIAIELDPREVTEAKVAAYALAGVNRVSLGVQDFHVDVQTAINRRQPFHVVYNTVKLLRDYGIAQINMDFLYGLPHQTLDHIKENLQYASILAPNRISLFGYAHVPWMKKHMRLIDEEALPNGEERLAQFDAATDQLHQLGFKSIGLDHFVRSDDPMALCDEEKTLRRNFQGYTTDAADALIGFGPSAISAFAQGYYQNTTIAKDYDDAVKAGNWPVMRGLALSDDDKIRAKLIETLMCYFEIDLREFCDRFDIGLEYFDASVTELAKLQKKRLVNISNHTVKIPTDARQAVRLVCAAFDSYLGEKKNRHAQVA